MRKGLIVVFFSLFLVPMYGFSADCFVLVNTECVWNDLTYTLTCLDDFTYFGCDGGGSGSGSGGGGSGGGGGTPGTPLSPTQTAKLNRAKALSKSALEDKAECAGLFTALGANGITEMSRVSYRGGSAGSTQCGIGVPASTTVNGSIVYLCPPFENLSNIVAARTLIHELLHTAGLNEAPYPGAMTPAEINNLVNQKCGL